MCILGKEISRSNIDEANPPIGYRGWFVKNSFSEDTKVLLSESAEYEWPKIAEGNPLEENRGIFSYKNHYNNNYYYYNNNYNNNNNYYYTAGLCYQWGLVVFHEKGYRSQFARPKSLVLLDKHENPHFLNHFNNIVELVAKEYNCNTISQKEYEQENPSNHSIISQ